MQRIVVLGGGFAGLWSAIGAARKLDEIGRSQSVEITLVDRNPYHAIRVRNYENDLDGVTVPFADVLDPVGIRHLTAEIRAIDPVQQEIVVDTGAGEQRLAYDRLVCAFGSRLHRPPLPGLAEHAFDVDTFAAARRLNEHLRGLGRHAASKARDTVVIAGAGFTGLEVATEMPAKLRHALGRGGRVILLDGNPMVGATIGDQARPVIEEALAALGVETRLDTHIARIDEAGVTLASGEAIPAATVVWCAGMRASPLTAMVSAGRDPLGRIAVDPFLRVEGVPNVFAAGDAAWSLIDGVHASVMSCQHARPMGRFAGHNVVADLFGQAMLPLVIDWYVTVLDLGAWGALYTVGWDRAVQATGAAAKATKQEINCRRIYPPRSGDRREIFAAAAPIVQAPPPEVPGH